MKRSCWLLLLFLAGCGGLLREPAGKPPALRPSPASDRLEELKETLRQAAWELEKGGERRRALEKRKLLSAISHDEPGLAEAVRREEAYLSLEAEKIYRAGLERHRLGDPETARGLYLAALRVDPDHEAAVEELKNGLTGDYIIYRPRERESLTSLARRVYGSRDLAVVLAAVNGLERSRKLPPGALVTIPRLDNSILEALANPVREKTAGGKAAPAMGGDRKTPAAGAGTVDTDALLAAARKLFNERRFQEAIREAEKVADGDPRASEAREIINGSYFNIGDLLTDEGSLPKALEAYRHVDLTYRNVEEIIGKLEKHMIELAEEHYIVGVKLFVGEQLEGAITEWEKTLALNPGHEKAGEDIRKATKLLEELQKVQ